MEIAFRPAGDAVRGDHEEVRRRVWRDADRNTGIDPVNEEAHLGPGAKIAPDHFQMRPRI